MKRRWIEAESGAQGVPDLFDALSSMRSAEETHALLVDLCTPAELEAISDRWRVVPYLLQGIPYREIHDLTAVSVTTIGRVARCLTQGEGGYQLAAARLQLTAASDAQPRRPAVETSIGRALPSPRSDKSLRVSNKGSRK